MILLSASSAWAQQNEPSKAQFKTGCTTDSKNTTEGDCNATSAVGEGIVAGNAPYPKGPDGTIFESTGLSVPEEEIIQFEIRALPKELKELQSNKSLQLKMLDGSILKLARARLVETPQGVTWVGKTQDLGATAIISRYGNAVEGVVMDGMAAYDLRSNAFGELLLFERAYSFEAIGDDARYASDFDSGIADVPDLGPGDGASPSVPVTIRVLMMYTDEAIAQADPWGWTGSRDESHIQAKIATQFEFFNEAAEASNIRHRAVIADFQKSGKQEDSMLGGYLDFLEGRIQTPGSLIDGYRTSANADLVQLWVSRGPYNASGLANVPRVEGIAFAKRAASVVVTGTDRYTCAHEIAHNIGAGHDHYVSPGGGIYDYSHGHTDLGTTKYTLMAYSDRCRDLSGPIDSLFCNQVLVFSGSNVFHNGVEMGGVNHNNAKTIRQMAPNTVQYRTWRP